MLNEETNQLKGQVYEQKVELEKHLSETKTEVTSLNDQLTQSQSAFEDARSQLREMTALKNDASGHLDTTKAELAALGLKLKSSHEELEQTKGQL